MYFGLSDPSCEWNFTSVQQDDFQQAKVAGAHIIITEQFDEPAMRKSSHRFFPGHSGELTRGEQSSSRRIYKRP